MVLEKLGSVAKQQDPCPPLPIEAGGDQAAKTPAISNKLVPVENSSISSPEDDSSLNETPRGDRCTNLSKVLNGFHFP